MKKKVFTFILTLILCIAMASPSFAADLPRFVDVAGLLTESEGEALTAKLDEISERHNFDVVVVTVNTTNGEDPEQYACDVYDYYNYGYGQNHDGVILLINMGERDWVITSTGYGRQAINSDAREYISGAFLGDLSAGNYRSAFNTFADCCDEVVAQAESGKVFKQPFNYAQALMIALVISVIIALLAVSSMKRKLKSVEFRSAAADYVRSGSLRITRANERYLYHNIVRTPKPQSNPSHGGGSSHSSSSGKF